MKIIEITSPYDERIIDYKSMKDNLIDSLGNSIFVAEGEKVVLKLLKYNLKIVSVFAKRSFYSEHFNCFENFHSTNLFTANDELLKNIIGFKMHTGVMAIAHKPEMSDINQLSDTIVCLNGIVDSENIGSIVRNCVAFGVDSLIYDKTTSSPYMRRAVRVSLGTIFTMKIYQSFSLINDLNFLKRNNYKIICAEITPNAKSIYNYHFHSKKIIIFGSEANGINKEILDMSDDIIYIPINEKIESLNVASSSEIFLSRIFI